MFHHAEDRDFYKAMQPMTRLRQLRSVVSTFLGSIFVIVRNTDTMM